MMNLKESGLSSRSINRKLSSLKAFATYLKKVGKMDKNPLCKISSQKISKRLPEFVAENDMDYLKWATLNIKGFAVNFKEL